MNNTPNVKYTRAMAVVAFIYALFYLWASPEPSEAALWFLGAIIAIWALGRVTIMEIVKTVWGGKDD